jgi:hypothetical protein
MALVITGNHTIWTSGSAKSALNAPTCRSVLAAAVFYGVCEPGQSMVLIAANSILMRRWSGLSDRISSFDAGRFLDDDGGAGFFTH